MAGCGAVPVQGSQVGKCCLICLGNEPCDRTEKLALVFHGPSDPMDSADESLSAHPVRLLTKRSFQKPPLTARKLGR